MATTADRLKQYFDNTAIISEIDNIISRKKGDIDQLERENDNFKRELKEYWIITEVHNQEEWFVFEENDRKLYEDYIIDDNRVIRLKDESKKSNESYMEELEKCKVYKNFSKINKIFESHFQNKEKIEELEEMVEEYEEDKKIVQKTNADKILKPAIDIYDTVAEKTKEKLERILEHIEVAKNTYDGLENRGGSITLKTEYRDDIKLVQSWWKQKMGPSKDVSEAVIYSLRSVVPTITKIYTEFLIEKIKEGKKEENIEDQNHLNDLEPTSTEMSNLKVKVMSDDTWTKHIESLKLPQGLKHIRD